MKSEATPITNLMAKPVTDLDSAQPTAAADDTTKQLVRIWQELLGVESIGVDQNYFDLGGDSSLAVQLFARIEKAFNVKLPLATLSRRPRSRNWRGFCAAKSQPLAGHRWLRSSLTVRVLRFSAFTALVATS